MGRPQPSAAILREPSRGEVHEAFQPKRLLFLDKDRVSHKDKDGPASHRGSFVGRVFIDVFAGPGMCARNRILALEKVVLRLGHGAEAEQRP